MSSPLPNGKAISSKIEGESALDLLNALKDIITNNDIYGVVHSAAVGDYYGEYAITGDCAFFTDCTRLAGGGLAVPVIMKVNVNKDESGTDGALPPDLM